MAQRLNWKWGMLLCNGLRTPQRLNAVALSQLLNSVRNGVAVAGSRELVAPEPSCCETTYRSMIPTFDAVPRKSGHRRTRAVRGRSQTVSGHWTRKTTWAKQLQPS